MAFVFWLSSGPLPQMPGGIEIPDKAEHFGAYAVLGALTWWAAAPLGAGRAAVIGILIAGFYGASDELHQWFVPGRTADFQDWGADIAGAATALIVIALVRWARARRSMRR